MSSQITIEDLQDNIPVMQDAHKKTPIQSRLKLWKN